MNNMQKNAHISKILSFLSRNKRAAFRPILEQLSSGNNPLLSPNLTNIHLAAQNLHALLQADPSICNSAKTKSLIDALAAVKEQDLITAYGKAKTRGTEPVSIDKYPLYYALTQLNPSSLKFFKLITQALIVCYFSQRALTKSKVIRVIKRLLQETHPSSDELSKLIDVMDSQQYDVLPQLLHIKVAIVKIQQRDSLMNDELLNEALYIINDAITGYDSLVKQSETPWFFDDTVTEDTADDQPSIIELKQDEATTIDERKTEHESSDQGYLVSVPTDVAKKSTYYQRSYAKQKARKTIRMSQFLDNAPNPLNINEQNHLIDLAKAQMLGADEQAKTIAFAVLFSLSTGAEPGFWWSWPVVENKDCVADYGINLSTQSWWHKIDMGERFWEPNEQQRTFVDEVDHAISLPLPSVIFDFLQQRLQIHTLGELFGESNLATINEKCDQWLGEFVNFGRRVTIAKVRNTLYWRVMQSVFDESQASFINAQPILRTPQSNAYTTLDNHTLINTYTACFKSLDFSAANHPLKQVGSKLRVKTDYLTTTLKTLNENYQQAHERFMQSSALTDLIELHNQLVTLTVMYGFINTGHRPCQDPFSRWVDFFPELNMVFVSDKLVDGAHECRASFYSDVFKQQLRHYRAHLQQLAVELQIHGAATLASAVALTQQGQVISTGLPFLFYLRFNKGQVTFESLSEKTIRAELQDFILPLNVGRHLLSIQLRKLGVPAEYIQYQLGHQSMGENPYADYSLLSVETVKQVLVPTLNQLSEHLGLYPAKGLEPKRHLIEIANTPHIDHVLGPIRRLNNYKQQRKASRQKLAHTFTQCVSSITTEEFKHTHIALLTHAMEKIAAESKQFANENLLSFSKLVQRYAQQHKLDITLPRKLIHIKPEKPTFYYESVFAIHTLEPARTRFNEQLETLNLDELTSSKLLGLFFTSLELFSHFTDQSRTKGILDALYQGNFVTHQGQLYLEIETRPNQIQRLPLDPISSLLFYRIQARLTQGQLKQVNLNALDKQRARLIQALAPMLSTRLFKQAIEAECRFFKPSALAAMLNGSRKTASLSRESFLRLVMQKRLKILDGKDVSTHDLAPSEHKDLDLVNAAANALKLKGDQSVSSNIKPSNFLNPIRRCLRNAAGLSRAEVTTKLKTYLSELNASPSTPSIFLILAMWSIERLNSPGERKESLVFSTVYGYFQLLDSRLAEHFVGRDIIDEDVEDLIESYNAITLSHRAEEQSTVATQLVHFHTRVLVKYFEQDEIEKADLEYTPDGQEQLINANFISPIEYDAIDHYITQSVHADNKLKLQLRLQHSFYAKLGFRPNELFKLEYRDLVHATAGTKDFITCRFNRLGRLKNQQSSRNVFFHNRLSDDETKQLAHWVSIRDSVESSELWISDFEQRTQEKSVFKTLLTDTLRTVTGDTRLVPYSYRHTAASLEYLAYFKQLENNIWHANGFAYPGLELTHWLGRKAEDYLQSCYGRTLPSRRFAHRVAQSLGHSTTETSLTNYGHFYEFVLPAYYFSSLSALSFRAIENLAPSINIANLRNQKSRLIKKYPKLNDNQIKQRYLELAAKNLAPHAHRASELVKPLAAKGPLKTLEVQRSTQFGLIEMFHLLSAISDNEVEREWLSQRFDLSSATIAQILYSYQALFHKTFMDPFSLFSQHGKTSRPAELKDTLNLIPRLNELVEQQSDALVQLIELWANYVDPTKSFWFFETPEQRQAMLTDLNSVLEIDASCLALTTISEVETAVIEGFRTRTAKGGTGYPIPRINHPRLISKVPGVGVFNTNQTLSMNREVNLLLSLSMLTFSLKSSVRKGLFSWSDSTNTS